VKAGGAWIDDDGQAETPRVAQGVAGLTPGAPLSLSLLTLDDPFHDSIAETIAGDLASCGAEVAVVSVPAEELFAPWPGGPAFGRGFDLVVWPWLQWVAPACEIFSTGEIPSAENPEGSNASGFSEAGYDAACGQVGLGPAAGEAYVRAVSETQSILAGAVPMLPLMQWPRVLIASELVCGLTVDATASSLLWNLEELTQGPGCPDE
jgi:peptide/nickel transport system substrate-binding protein